MSLVIEKTNKNVKGDQNELGIVFKNNESWNCVLRMRGWIYILKTSSFSQQCLCNLILTSPRMASNVIKQQEFAIWREKIKFSKRPSVFSHKMRKIFGIID